MRREPLGHVIRCVSATTTVASGNQALLDTLISATFQVIRYLGHKLILANMSVNDIITKSTAL